MILQVIALRDAALGAYMRPAFYPSVGVAVRGFTDEVNKQDSPMYAHPEDYAIYHLGTFDDEVGVFKLFPDPIRIGEAVNVKS